MLELKYTRERLESQRSQSETAEVAETILCSLRDLSALCG